MCPQIKFSGSWGLAPAERSLQSVQRDWNLWGALQNWDNIQNPPYFPSPFAIRDSKDPLGESEVNLWDCSTLTTSAIEKTYQSNPGGSWEAAEFGFAPHNTTDKNPHSNCMTGATWLPSTCKDRNCVLTRGKWHGISTCLVECASALYPSCIWVCSACNEKLRKTTEKTPKKCNI